jgi:hypothetical protein
MQKYNAMQKGNYLIKIKTENKKKKNCKNGKTCIYIYLPVEM